MPEVRARALASGSRGHRRLRLRPARRAHRPGTRSSRATPPGCWSTGPGRGRRRTAHVRDLPDLLEPGDLLVVNDTRVLPARLHLRKATGGAAEVLLLDAGSTATAGRRWCGPAGGCPPGTELVPPTAGRRDLVGAWCGDDLRGRPPAGRRSPGPTGDRARRPSSATARCRCRPYITDAARRPRALPDRVRRPAGLGGGADRRAPPDRRRARRLPRPRASSVAGVELVVGLGTFRPITADRVEDHVMHTERYRVPAGHGTACARTRAAGGRVVAVGTTAVRALESAAAHGRARGPHRPVHPRPATVPGRRPAAHQLPPAPVVAARADRRVRRAPLARTSTRDALAEGYRFLSFGDAMLLSGAGRRQGAGTGRPCRAVPSGLAGRVGPALRAPGSAVRGPSSGRCPRCWPGPARPGGRCWRP